jgi:hypothetical protein
LVFDHINHWCTALHWTQAGQITTLQIHPDHITPGPALFIPPSSSTTTTS